MQAIISTAIGLIIMFATIRVLMKLAYFIGSRSFIVREVTNAVLKLFKNYR